MDSDTGRFWDIRASGESEGAITLYGEIFARAWDDEITPRRFQEDLDALGDVQTLRVYINSPGGNVFAGWNILNLLARHPAKKIGYNDGLAASIAFDLLVSMDEVVAMENSLFMTHNASGMAFGDKHKMQEVHDLLDRLDVQRAEMAAKRCGKTLEEMLALQDAETWYSAKEAVAAGFADRIESCIKLSACMDGDFLQFGQEKADMRAFRNFPAAFRDALPQKPPEDASPDTEESPPGTTVPAPEPEPDPKAMARVQQQAEFTRIRTKILGGNIDDTI